MPNAAPKPPIWLPAGGGKVDLSEKDHGHVVHGHGWFEPYCVTKEQEETAAQSFQWIKRRCDELRQAKWTNDPLVFPLDASSDAQEEHYTAGAQRKGIHGIVPFAPNDQQYFIKGVYDAERSYLTTSAKPGHDMYTEGHGELNSAWTRLCDFNMHDGCLDLFRESGQKGYHMGRVFQGALDNGYLVEALNAVTLRPKLVRHMFYHYDMDKSIYILRLYKHGMWHRVEIDDYVPVSPPPAAHHENHGPICCTSEHFPHVLWPSLAEKAYAKLFTKRKLLVGDDAEDVGGWEAIGAGGRVEDALVLLTGGVAGRFRTREVSADRLALYLIERQQDTLFVCRVNQPACEMYGVKLNPYYPYAVNRAIDWEGRLYVQVFCGAPTCYDGGLEDTAVPYSLIHSKEYPEGQAEGFFWCDINDFHLYFDTIIECHLTSTPPCEIPGMPPSSRPMWQPPPPEPQARQQSPQGRSPRALGYQPSPGQKNPTYSPDGERLYYFESVHCNPGEINRHNNPEFTIDIPGNAGGCEVFCSFDQYDKRIMMTTPWTEAPADVLLKAYVKVNDAVVGHGQKDLWQLCCKSNWFPCNHSMVGFHCRRGCRMKVVAEFPDSDVSQTQTITKSIFRVYCSAPNFSVAANVANKRHALGALPEGETPAATKFSLVGCVDAALMENPDNPDEFDPETDGLRKPEQDINKSFQDLKKECSVM